MLTVSPRVPSENKALLLPDSGFSARDHHGRGIKFANMRETDPEPDRAEGAYCCSDGWIVWSVIPDAPAPLSTLR